MQEETINNPLTKCEDNEQYSHPSCLWIHGLESNRDKKNEDMIENITEFYNALELPFNEKVIGCVHRVGKEYRDKIQKKKVRSIILTFKSWKARQQHYNA